MAQPCRQHLPILRQHRLCRENLREVEKRDEKTTYLTQRIPDLRESRRMSSMRALALKNLGAGVDPAEGGCCLEVETLCAETADGGVDYDSIARGSV